MILMDVEKQNPKARSFSKELDGSLNGQRRSRHPQTDMRRLRMTISRGVGLVVFLLLLKVSTDRTAFRSRLSSWNSSQNFPHPHHRLSLEEREQLFLSVPSVESALEASRAYATHPHLAGSSEDSLDAKAILHLFQDEFGIRKSPHLPIYDAGTEESRNATLKLTTSDASSRPNAWIDTYYPVMNTGTEQSLAILNSDGTPSWTADLLEDGDPRDEDAHKYRETIPPWHGLSCDGDVTGQLIYANYGRKEDYDELVTRGTNLTGKIILTRYGGNFRGLKIKGAEELGAAGVIIYSDPRDDGFVTVKNDYSPYPAGPARNPTSVQRGSVQYLSSYPGDPTTPGYPAYPDAERTEGSNIPKIPSLPLSWQNAQKLLEEIGELYVHDKDGKKHLSGQASQSSVRLVNHVNTKVTPIWNAMASIPGHIRNEVVVLGCHRDAWVMGAADPTSGTVSLHEIIRGYGALLRRGWKPLRTIVIASWDAEEYGLIGSTEWGEDFAPWIQDHVVAYLNVDVSVAGSRFNVHGSPSLAHIIKKTASDIAHPTKGDSTLWDARNDHGPYVDSALNGTVDEDFMVDYTAQELQRQASETGVYPLGSGSDFTVFLQRLGVASSDQGFGGTPNDAPYHYHSIYDTQAWQERYADPSFTRHVAVAKYLGLLGLRITDSIVLPINTTQYSFELDEYLNAVENLVPSLGEKAQEVHFSSLRKTIQKLQDASAKLDDEKFEAEEDFKKLLKRIRFPGHRRVRHRGRRTGALRHVADWIKGIFGVSPPTHEELQLLTLRSADSWEEYLEYASVVDLDLDLDDELKGVADAAELRGLPFPIHKFIKAAKRVARANVKLRAFERGFISEEGIKDREWYKHLGVAPGKWLGYGATTFPALTEAITFEKDVTLIRHEAKRLESLLSELAEAITP